MTPDKLGCYRVGDLKFYSKLEAIEEMQRTGIHLHWDFNEAAFSSYDWTTEPEESLEELYLARAQQIRDNYDYVILMYSGGSDSTQILHTFLKNNIKIDEVASFVNYDLTRDKDNYLNAEIFNVALPTVEQFKEQYPWINYRHIDLTKLTIDFFSDPKNKFDWIYSMNFNLNPNGTSRQGLGLKVKEWREVIESGKKMAIVWGCDKPRIVHENNKFSFRFIDITDASASVASMAGQMPYTDELFYWSPDMAKIPIKQAHILKRYLSVDNLDNLRFVSTTRDEIDLAYKVVNGKKYWISVHGVNHLIYPDWDITTFTRGKTPSLIFSERDDWFFKMQDALTFKHNWEMGVIKLWQTIPDYWKNNPKDIKKWIKLCVSKDYFLEK